MKAAFPKLLVASEFAPNGHGGGEALIGQLLTGYPPQQIYWWSCQKPRKTELQLHSQKHFHCPIPAKLFPHKKFTRQKSWFLEKLWAPYAAAHLRKVLAQVRPDQVWLVLHGWGIPAFYRAGLVGTYRTHASIWDFPDNRSRCALFGPRRAERMMRTIETLYKQADTCDVISEPMLEDMAQRTSRTDAIIVHSGFEPWHLESMSNADGESSPNVEIAYAGTVIVGEVFRFFLAAVEKIRRSLPRPVRLTFFGGRSYRSQPWFDPEWMREEDHLDDVEFNKRMRRSTWGLTLMDLTDDDPRYNRFSFPNKFGTYLTAGLPLIVLAHRESTAAKMIREYPVGFFTDTTDLDELSAFLQRVLVEPHPRQRFRDEILRCAAAEFDIAQMRQSLWRAFGLSMETHQSSVAAGQHHE